MINSIKNWDKKLFMDTKRQTIVVIGLGYVGLPLVVDYMKKIGLEKYKIGIRYFSNQQKLATEKELSISHFKEGFSNRMLPTIVFES
jgi:UDP-N-acetyl-D-mannosaminuronate dehydrogenase